MNKRTILHFCPFQKQYSMYCCYSAVQYIIYILKTICTTACKIMQKKWLMNKIISYAHLFCRLKEDCEELRLESIFYRKIAYCAVRLKPVETQVEIFRISTRIATCCLLFSCCGEEEDESMIRTNGRMKLKMLI
jgi:hypothetical protein